TFYWLHKKGFDGRKMIGSAYELAGEAEGKSITIRNIGACSEKEILPYSIAASYDADALQLSDAGKDADGDTLEATYIPGSIADWYELQEKLSKKQKDPAVKEYLDLQEAYSEYVKEHDLQITNAVLGVLGRTIEDDSEERTLSQIFGIIRETLSSSIAYNEGVSTYSGSSDFLQYVLEQSRSGYDVHYATAAVLMFRYMGVPARYVEGYYISPEEAAEMEPGKEYILDESHAHAWAEYYLEGVGWLPFETTPGYDQSEEAEVARKGEGITGSIGNSSYSRNSQSYEPPPEEDNEDTQDKDRNFRFTTAVLLRILLIILITLLILLLLRILGRYLRFKNAMKDIEGSENRQAIIKSYAYASMLRGVSGIEDPDGDGSIMDINLEAMYSTHAMDDAKRQLVTDYTGNVRRQSMESFSVLKKIKHHFIDWIC
ncbi:MAG: transglutaminase domain-containing protein, partial [Lachnospiraceae bacterium]|nr:transglutaminase domain-containing protein [Lachnospiraceae bacterium]